MGFNPSLHPRGPNGRFTKSFAKLAGSAEKKRIGAARSGFKARPPFRSPGDAHGFLSGLSTQKNRQPGQMDRMLAQLRQANQSLRSGKPDQSGFEQLLKPTTEDVTVYRTVPGQKFGGAQPSDLKGFVVKDAGYFPTSLAPPKPQPGDVRLRIDVPKGTKAAASPDTSEMVLDAGLEMSVDDVTTGPDGTTEMHLTALPDSPSGDAPASNAAGAGDFDQRYEQAASGAAALNSAPRSYERAEDGDFTPDQSDAMFNYFSAGFIQTNRQLRAGQFDPNTRVEGWVGQLDGILAESQLPGDVQAWRGIANARRMLGDRLDGDLTGAEWREDAYMSTSTSRNVSEEFATDGDEPLLMRVLIPSGTGALEVSGEDFEAELMLQRGLTLRVVADHGSTDGVRHIDVEVVPADATQTT